MGISMELKDALKQAIKSNSGLMNDKEGLKTCLNNLSVGRKPDKVTLRKIIDSVVFEKFVRTKLARSLEERKALLAEIAIKIKDEQPSYDEEKIKDVVDTFIHALSINLTDESEENLLMGEGVEAGWEEDEGDLDEAVTEPEAPVEMPVASVDNALPVQQVVVWTCTCQHKNEGAFCVMCGKNKELAIAQCGSVWQCRCGKTNYGAFCTNCGESK